MTTEEWLRKKEALVYYSPNRIEVSCFLTQNRKRYHSIKGTGDNLKEAIIDTIRIINENKRKEN